jgi:hypothetical protein
MIHVLVFPVVIFVFVFVLLFLILILLAGAELAHGFEELFLALLLGVEEPLGDDVAAAHENNLEGLIFIVAWHDICGLVSHG